VFPIILEVSAHPAQGYTPSTPPFADHDLRLRCMEFRLRHAAEFLAAFIADHRACDFTFFESGWLDGGVCFVVFGVVSDFVEGFVLVIFEPL
jgi:hypothetical protein